MDGQRDQSCDERHKAQEVRIAQVEAECRRIRKMHLELYQRLASTKRDEPGVEMRVDRIEEAQDARRALFQWLTGGSLMGLIGLICWLLWKSGGG